MRLSSLKTAQERRTALISEKNIQLDNVTRALVDDETRVHCENVIGAVSLPLGLAGPLSLQGVTAQGEFYLPLATSEGALIASVNRGCKATYLSGGINAYVYRVGTTRGPVFFVDSIKKNKEFYQWLKTHESYLQDIAASTSHHLKFESMMIKGVSQYVFVRFYFNTQDAMGMNMATIATQKMVEYIEQQSGVTCLSVAGNFDIDKKPAWLNFIDNRGFKVWAEVTIKKEIVSEVLKTTPEQLYEVWYAKCMLGSAMSGSLGFNGHFANIVAAFFAATGQDLAHIVEGSMGITTTKVTPEGDLYVSVYLPAIMLGTVGGGTNLKTQQEALSIVGVQHAEELAEVLGGAVLAGEVSLLASLAEGSLAKAHKKLGR